MSSDAIIAGLKQGNAIEMASLEEVKEGMGSVIDGLMKECYNRSDALSDLMEKVQLESSSAAAKTMTAEQKTQLTKIIQDAIGDCEKAIRVNDDKKARDHDQAAATFGAEKEVLDMMLAHGKAQEHLYQRRQKALYEKRRETVDDELCKIKEEDKIMLFKLCDFHKDAGSKFLERRRSRREEINNGHEAAQSALREQIASLERIATIAKIDLKATSEGDMSASGIPFDRARCGTTSEIRFRSRAVDGHLDQGSIYNPLARVVMGPGRNGFYMRDSET